ncbi:hypothetical protein SDJN02_06525, partial [Cucurbita argyrosperma subsp. argyrosperma]
MKMSLNGSGSSKRRISSPSRGFGGVVREQRAKLYIIRRFTLDDPNIPLYPLQHGHVIYSTLFKSEDYLYRSTQALPSCLRESPNENEGEQVVC